MTVTTTNEPAFDPANPGGATPPVADGAGFDASPAEHEAFNDPTPGPGAAVPGAGDGTVPGGVSDLSVFDEEYDEAEVPTYEEVPDGKYQVRVQRAALGTSQAGDAMLKWDLVVLSGQDAGRHVFKNAVITHKSLPFVKGDLHTLGVQLSRFSDLPNHLEALLDQTLEITKRTRGEYTNVYFNRRLEGLSSEGFEGLASDEPTPF
jgi:hypothetical protein